MTKNERFWSERRSMENMFTVIWGFHKILVFRSWNYDEEDKLCFTFSTLHDTQHTKNEMSKN